MDLAGSAGRLRNAPATLHLTPGPTCPITTSNFSSLTSSSSTKGETTRDLTLITNSHSNNSRMAITAVLLRGTTGMMLLITPHSNSNIMVVRTTSNNKITPNNDNLPASRLRPPGSSRGRTNTSQKKTEATPPCPTSNHHDTTIRNRVDLIEGKTTTVPRETNERMTAGLIDQLTISEEGSNMKGTSSTIGISRTIGINNNPTSACNLIEITSKGRSGIHQCRGGSLRRGGEAAAGVAPWIEVEAGGEVVADRSAEPSRRASTITCHLLRSHRNRRHGSNQSKRMGVKVGVGMGVGASLIANK